MSIVSHLHQLFNVETCQANVHTLRWKDRVRRSKAVQEGASQEANTKEGCCKT